MSENPIPFSFKHFQSFPEAGRFGELQLPEGFEPLQVKVQAEVEGDKPLNRTFEWIKSGVMTPMWSKDKAKPDLQRFSGKTSLIAAGAELVGDMRFQGAVQVDGKVTGNLLATEGLVRVSVGGLVEGEVRAPISSSTAK